MYIRCTVRSFCLNSACGDSQLNLIAISLIYGEVLLIHSYTHQSLLSAKVYVDELICVRDDDLDNLPHFPALVTSINKNSND